MKFDNENSNIAWCPGCGNFLILKILKSVLEELNFTPQNTVLVSGIGQGAKIPQYVNTNYFNGLHGRAIPVACGVKAANKNLNVIVVSGDGDIYGEGGNHFLHAIRRNPDITVLVCNNMVYALTKGQASPTANTDYITKLQPHGALDETFNPIAVAIAENISFAGRAFCQDIEQTKKIMKQAILNKGFSLLDIFQPCVTFNKVNTYQWFKERVYYLEKEYDRLEGFQKSLETEKLPLGIFFKNQRKTFEETFEIQEGILADYKDKLNRLIEKYCY
jgi:2-oxoglutarate ferredoxin oxidoreductase subunit beta